MARISERRYIFDIQLAHFENPANWSLAGQACLSKVLKSNYKEIIYLLTSLQV